MSSSGIFLHGSRPRSKAAIKIAVHRAYTKEPDPDTGHVCDLYCIVLENTVAPIFPPDFDGSLALAERNGKFGPHSFVGPDPFKNRKFYGILQYSSGKKRWEVK